MAEFRTYAEVLTPDHASWVAYTSGIRKSPPGFPIKELLRRNGGTYVDRLELTEEVRGRLRALAQMNGDQELAKIAENPEVVVSLEHLRDFDPETRIVVGYTLSFSPEESERLGLNHQGAHDPRDTVVVAPVPGNRQRVQRS